MLGNPLSNVDSFGLFCMQDFVAHYYGGSGTAIDLSDVGLLDDFRNSSVKNHVEDFKRILRRAGANRARSLCGGRKSGTAYSVFSVSSNTVTNVSFDSMCLFSVGASTFFRSATCFLTADCCARTYSLSCGAAFGIRDKFEHPLNMPFEVGGVPYAINASWAEQISASGSF